MKFKWRLTALPAAKTPPSTTDGLARGRHVILKKNLSENRHRRKTSFRFFHMPLIHKILCSNNNINSNHWYLMRYKQFNTNWYRLQNLQGNSCNIISNSSEHINSSHICWWIHLWPTKSCHWQNRFCCNFHVNRDDYGNNRRQLSIDQHRLSF